MIKIAHMADIHWRGLARHEEYKKCFEDAFEKLRKAKPDVILIAGDIVHSKTQGISPELIDCLTWWFRNLAEIASVHVTLGNHDGLIQNEDRQDAITPILTALKNPNIHLHKKSCTVEMMPGYNLCIFSCFDEDGWKNVAPDPEKVNIATFHGPVSGCVSDDGWKIEGGEQLSFFEKFDFVMLGDIHKRQVLDAAGRVQFSGSCIQQNYSEQQEKGFLLWAIESKEKFVTKFVQIKNDFPYVTLNYSGSLEDLLAEAANHSQTSRFRIKISDELTQSEFNKIKSSLKSQAKPLEIVFKQEKLKQNIHEQIKQDFKLDSLENVEKLIFDYHSDTNIPEKTKDTMQAYLKNAWRACNIDENNAGGNFQIKKLEFDNTFGYGEGNCINFDAAEGITGIFGKNASGKSSICGTLAYGLYNGTDRGSLKNLHIVNTRKNYCNVKVKFAKSGVDYLLERQTTKTVSKKGEVSAPTNLNLFLVDPSTGEAKDMSEEQRRETEKTLRDLVGNLDDFLLTSLSSQGNVNKFIDLSASIRKASLAKFLRLEIFEQLSDAIKGDLNFTKKMLDAVSEKQFDKISDDLALKIEKSSNERDQIEKETERLNAALINLQTSLSSGSSETFTQLEISDQQKSIEDIHKKISDLKENLKTESQKNEELLIKKNEIKELVQKFDRDDLLKKKSELDAVVKSLATSEQKIEKKEIEINRDKKEVEKLSDVPCEDKFPTCKYIVSAKLAQKSLEDKHDELEKLQLELSSLKKSHQNLIKESIEEKLKDIKDLAEKVSIINLEISSVQNEKTKISGKIENLEILLDQKQQILQKMKANLCDESAVKAREDLVKSKKEIEAKIKENLNSLSLLSETIGRCSAEVKQIKNEKEEFAVRSQKHSALKLLSKALSKSGVPLNIIRKSLPAINAEIAGILENVSSFKIELVSDQDSNDMEIYIDYGDSRRVIECASGMEKMMASLAIRAALIRISNLPKSDLFIVDEGFGALDGKNLESCSSLLRELSKYFKSVLIISHIDAVKDAVDNIIEISERGKDAHVFFD